MKQQQNTTTHTRPYIYPPEHGKRVRFMFHLPHDYSSIKGNMPIARMLPFGEKFTALCAQLLDSFEDGAYQKQTITCILEEIFINNAPKDSSADDGTDDIRLIPTILFWNSKALSTT